MRLFFVGLSKAENVQFVAKNIGESQISNLTREIENIPAQMLKHIFLNFRKRCELLITAGGGHIE
jgi:hypothetical protein